MTIMYSCDKMALASVNATIANYLRAVHDEPIAMDKTQSRNAIGEALSSVLLSPVDKELSAARAIWIVPHSDVYAIPFSALPYSGGYLVNKYIVAYALCLPQALQMIDARDCKVDSFTFIGDLPYSHPYEAIPESRGAVEDAMSKCVAKLSGRVVPLFGKAASKQSILRAIGDTDSFCLIGHGVVLRDIGDEDTPVRGMINVTQHVLLSKLSSSDVLLPMPTTDNVLFVQEYMSM
jgi:hypothetical protein